MTILIRITDNSNNRDLNNLNRSLVIYLPGVESIIDSYNSRSILL